MGLLVKVFFIATVVASSQAHALELPQSLFNSLSSRLQLGQCQKEFLGSVDMFKELKTSDPQQTLVLVPCAQWAYNMRWLVYMAVVDADTPDKVNFIKPLHFSHYLEPKGLHATEYVENYNWNQEKQILSSRHFLNGKPQCGEKVVYEWNSLIQEFKVKKMMSNGDCDDLDSPWSEKYSEN